MSFSHQPLPASSIATHLAKLVAQRESLLKRIETLEKSATPAGYENETDAAKLEKVKAKRIDSFQTILAKTNASIDECRAQLRAAETLLEQKEAPGEIAQQLEQNDEPRSESKDESSSEDEFVAVEADEIPVAARSANRDWYKKFEEEFILPAFERLSKNPDGDWKKIDDAAARKEFLLLAGAILLHYQSERQATKNLKNYIDGIAIADRELLSIKNSFFGYLSLIPQIPSLLSTTAGDGGTSGLSLAIATLKKNNPPEGPKNKKPIFTVNCDAERDFVLMVNRFVDFFILEKDAKCSYKEKAINIALSMDILLKVLLKNKIKFETDIQKYESPAVSIAPRRTPLVESQSAHLPRRSIAPRNNRSNTDPTHLLSRRIVVEDVSPVANAQNSRLDSVIATRQTPLLVDVNASPEQNNPSPASSHNSARQSEAFVLPPAAIPSNALIRAPSPVASPEQAEPLSFFQRHKKKILWGLAIGFAIGLCIATAGVLAIAFSAAAATAAVVVGATSIVKAIAIGAGLTGAAGITGAVAGATKGAVADCKKTHEPVSSLVAGHSPITNGGNSAYIHQQANMSVAISHTAVTASMPSENSISAHTSEAASLSHALSDEYTHSPLSNARETPQARVI